MSSDEEVSPHNRKKFKSERSFETQPPTSTDLSEGDQNIFGPVLPPHLLKKKREECREEQKIYGPVLPENLRSRQTEDEGPESREKTKEKRMVLGPEIPEHLRKPDEDETEESDEGNSDYCFGPSPALMSDGPSTSYTPTIRQRRINKESEDDSAKQRESWMLELPEDRTGNLTLGPRRFKTRVITEQERDRSVWTDTPEDKIKKKCGKKEKDYDEILKAKIIDERNKEMEKLIEKAKRKHKKKEDLSLMEMHTKKLKKKKKEAEKEGKKPERRPFDRDIDLQIRRVDEGQRRAILNKAMYLNSKFSSGENKYL